MKLGGSILRDRACFGSGEPSILKVCPVWETVRRGSGCCNQWPVTGRRREENQCRDRFDRCSGRRSSRRSSSAPLGSAIRNR